MSAVVCGKRASSIFEELAHTPPLPASKRARCCSAGASSSSPPTAALRLSPSPFFDQNQGASSGDGNPFAAHLARLRSLFPEMDPQLLQRALEESGDDLDSAIKFLNDLQLESIEIKLGSVGSKLEAGFETNSQLSTEGTMNNNCEDAAVPVQPSVECPSQHGSEWVELFVREMMNASDMNDARARASRALEAVEKSIMAHAGAEAMESFHKENMSLKEKIQALLGENNLLKRAVAIQHDCQKDYGAISQELEHLKQLASQYQEQLRTLEVNNYALAMHLKEAQHSSSIPGRYHPDVF